MSFSPWFFRPIQTHVTRVREAVPRFPPRGAEVRNAFRKESSFLFHLSKIDFLLKKTPNVVEKQTSNKNCLFTIKKNTHKLGFIYLLPPGGNNSRIYISYVMTVYFYFYKVKYIETTLMPIIVSISQWIHFFLLHLFYFCKRAFRNVW